MVYHIKKHQQNKHKGNKVENLKVKKHHNSYYCKQCDNLFTGKCSLRDHKKNKHEGVKNVAAYKWSRWDHLAGIKTLDTENHAHSC